MPRHLPTPGAIVVVTTEDDRFSRTRERGLELARERNEPVILYDWDAPSLMGEPLPTWWSSDGWEGRFPDRLEAADLEAAGRAEIADQVKDAGRRGLEAFGWLPSDHGPDALADYVNRHGASAVVVPGELADLEGLDALLAGTSRPAEVLEERASAEVVVI